MATSPPSPRSTRTGRSPVVITQPSDRAAVAVWRRLCEGLAEPWLDEIGVLRTEGDDFEASLDIWSVALAAGLKAPDRRDTASVVLARLRKLAEETEHRGAADS